MGGGRVHGVHRCFCLFNQVKATAYIDFEKGPGRIGAISHFCKSQSVHFRGLMFTEKEGEKAFLSN